MKRYFSLLILIGTLFILAACTYENDLQLNDEDLEPNTESLSRSVPQNISLKQLETLTKRTYYAESKTYLCSDSLGKVCFWDANDNPTFDKELGYYERDFAGVGKRLYEFKKGYGTCYHPRNPEDMEMSHLDTRRYAYKFYWWYDEKDGSFTTSIKPIDTNSKQRGRSMLMEITDKYMIIRIDYPVHPSRHASYSLKVYKAIHDKEAAEKWWYTDAPDADKELGEYLGGEK